MAQGGREWQRQALPLLWAWTETQQHEPRLRALVWFMLLRSEKPERFPDERSYVQFPVVAELASAISSQTSAISRLAKI
ncbi:MAG: hypothetical protein ACJ795_16150 [Ktedonobacteraceae bacterium]